MKKMKMHIGLCDYTFGVKGVWCSLFIIFLLSLLIGFSGVLNAACLKLLIDIASGESEIGIWTGALLSISAIAFKAVLDLLRDILNVKTQNKIAGKAKRDLLEHMEKIPYLKLSHYHSGDLLTRLSDDTDICARMLPETLGGALVGAASCLIALVYGFHLNWKLSILCVVLSPLAVIWSKLILPYVQKYATLMREEESEIRAFSQEEILYIPVIKSFFAYSLSKERLDKKFKKLSQVRVKMTMASSALNSGATIVGFFSFIGAAGFGAYLSISGEITVGTIVGFIQLLNYIVWPFTELMPILSEFQKGKAARKRIREIETITREEEEIEGKQLLKNFIVKVCDMSFSYGTEVILRDVNMELEENQLVGVMGPSGCGKSTFMQLLMALFQPSHGKIFITNGREDVTGTSMRKYISYVPQDHLLISGTIAENIAYGKDTFEMEDVILAAKRAEIHEYICTLPEKYNTWVRERGGNFSFGQAQRIAIARALYKDAPILILDEPTASLDSESKKNIIRTLQKEAKHRLCIMVCHDQTENCSIFDRILKFENGKIKMEENTENIAF